jgi:hypothetical protein
VTHLTPVPATGYWRLMTGEAVCRVPDRRVPHP